MNSPSRATHAAGEEEHPGSAPSLPRLPAVDGMRAVAVILVLLYHGGALDSGYIGVDLFFVISGFLITSLLLGEWESQGRIQMWAFWMRRARRLLPALFLVVAAALLATLVFEFGKPASVVSDSLASIFYVSNWWFIAAQASYASLNDLTLLRHTWSLSVEEQWYVFLPLVLVFILPRLRSRLLLAVLLAALALCSSALMASLSPADGADFGRVYLGTDTRMQSLLVGSALAGLLTPGALERLRPVVWLAGWFGSAVIVIAIATFSISAGWTYRGGFLILALGVACVLLTIVGHPEGLVSRSLASSPLVFVGLISYGLYLWHWVVYHFIVTSERTGLSGVPLLSARICVTGVIAYASYRFVESPIRRGTFATQSTRVRRSIFACAVGVLAALLWGTATARVPVPRQESADATKQAALQSASTKPVPALTMRPGSTAHRAVLVGDSVALSLLVSFEPDVLPGLGAAPGTEFGCGVIPYDTAIDGRRQPALEKCNRWRARNREKQIAAAEADIGVVFAGSGEQYDRWADGGALPFTTPRWSQLTRNDYIALLQEIKRHTSRVVLVLDTCHGMQHPDAQTRELARAVRDPDVVNDSARIRAVNDAARAAASSVSFRVRVVDPNGFLCSRGYARDVDGVRMRADGLDFTAEGARKMWLWLAPQLTDEH